MLNGYLMSRNVKVCKIVNNNIEILNDDLCPLLIKRVNDIEFWLANRAIDSHRPSSRILRKILRIKTSDSIETVLKFNAVSLTDNYWFKEFNSDSIWEDAIKVTDYFKDVIVHDNIDMTRLPNNLRTFELTNTGSYEKCWTRDGNEWLMLKRQSKAEVISELIACKVGKILGFNIARYFQSAPNIIATYNFIHDWEYNFEDAFSIVGEDEDVNYNFQQLVKLSPKLAKGYFEMLIFDALFQNVDRHTHNYGVIRNRVTGEVLDFAPLYDHNMCLYGSKMNLGKTSPNMFFENIEIGLKYYKDYKLPIIYRGLLDKVNTDSIEINKIANDFIFNNYIKIKDILETTKIQ